MTFGFTVNLRHQHTTGKSICGDGQFQLNHAISALIVVNSKTILGT